MTNKRENTTNVIYFKNIRVGTNYIEAVAFDYLYNVSMEVMVHKSRADFYVSDKKYLTRMIPALEHLQKLFKTQGYLRDEHVIRFS
jgi:hypothetical protein